MITQDDEGIIQAKSDLFQITVNSPDFFTMLQRQLPPNEHPELTEWLRNWRKETARELGLSAYIILTNKVLLAIASGICLVYGISNEEELMAVKGFGHNQLRKYGKEILDIVLQYKQLHPEEYEEEGRWDSKEL